MHEESRSHSTANRVAREVALAGDEAVAWLAELDWSVTPHSSRLQIFADLIRTEAFAIGRIWHTPASMSFLRQNDYSDGLIHSVLGIEGTHALVSGTEQLALNPGQLHLQSLDEPLAISAQQPVARLFFVASWESLHGPGALTELPRGGLFGGQSAFREVFTSAAHAALNSVASVEGPAFAGVRNGLQHLFASMLAHDAAGSARPSGSAGGASRDRRARESQSTSLLRRASKVIEQQAGDVSFDVTKLARSLGVSAASLYRSYEEANTTPASQLRQVRARRARTLLNEDSGAGVSDTQNLKLVAEHAGFGSVRAMRRALLGNSDSQSSGADGPVAGF